jgi:hypothetical protein
LAAKSNRAAAACRKGAAARSHRGCACMNTRQATAAAVRACAQQRHTFVECVGSCPGRGGVRHRRPRVRHADAAAHLLYTQPPWGHVTAAQQQEVTGLRQGSDMTGEGGTCTPPSCTHHPPSAAGAADCALGPACVWQ